MKKELKLFKSPLALILFAWSLLSCIIAIVKGNDLIIYSGVVGALALYTKRKLDEESLAFLTKVYIIVGSLSAIIGVIIALIQQKSFMWISISQCFLGGVLFVAMIILARTKYTDYIKDCSNGVFWGSFAIALIVVPFVIAFIVGIVGVVFTFILGVLVLISALALGMVLSSGMGSGGGSSIPKQYMDDKGFMHATDYHRREANEAYKEQRKQDN